jgi:hypothetical protein
MLRTFTIAPQTTNYQEVLEWIKSHPGGTARQMSKQKQDVKNRIIYFKLFGEVLARNPGKVRTEYHVIGDGRGQPCQQLHYFWIGD